MLSRLVLTGFALVSLTRAQTISVGSGAPTPGVTTAFIAAWQNNGFNKLVADPSANVAKYGTTGLIQQFPSLVTGGGTYALIKPDTTENFNVQQVYPAMFAYYGSVGVAVTGYPTSDTLSCPKPLTVANAGLTCQYQTFQTNYVLFVYSAALPAGGQNFSLADPYYTKWNSLLGMFGLGAANSAQTAVVSSLGTKATVQTFDQGALFNITSGLATGRLISVQEPIYDFYASLGAAASSLGVPITEALKTTTGLMQQTFEGGAIAYDPTTRIPVLRPPVAKLSLAPSGAISLKTGDTISAQVVVYAGDNSVLTDRVVSWNTSNGQIAQVVSNGLTATIKGVGSGTANITVSAEGKSSAALIITVAGQCCQIGDGAPTAVIQQAFRDAVTRNKLSVQLPATSGAVRAGNGYVQILQSTGTPPVNYLVAVPDNSAAGYVVASPILDVYNTLGGPAGSLGYPQADATAGGRQTFEQGALGGNPVQLVTGAILAKWALTGYEAGPVGQVTGSAGPFQSFRGTSGLSQLFKTGMIVATTKAYSITGPVLAAYSTAGGPTGNLGAPITDQRVVGSLNQQDFEGGVVQFATGSQTATVVPSPRQPVVTANPPSLLGGNTVSLVAGGFSSGATVKVSQTGLPDFQVTVPSGAYVWKVFVPASATPGVVTVTATDVSTKATASATYTVRNPTTDPLSITSVSGDLQNGAPGALLAKPLVALVQDLNGNPVAGRTVTFAASPGAQVSPASAITDANGQASTTLRLPAGGGIALATATAGGDVVTFSARAAAFSLSNFPALSQAVSGVLGNGSDTIGAKGALLTAAASVVRYYQQSGTIPQPNGLAGVLTLNSFLRTFCAVGTTVCDGFVTLGKGEQTVNLWRVGAFAGNSVDVSIETATTDAVRDLVASGSPVLLGLTLTSGGSHFVVATGIAADGSLVIADPAPNSPQTNLSGYLNGTATLTAALRLIPKPPAAGAFLVTATAPVSISSSSGPCGKMLQIPDTAALPGAVLTTAPGALYFLACDGANTTPYQLDVNTTSAALGTFTGLAAISGLANLSGTPPASLLISRSGNTYQTGPVTAAILTGGVVNAASFTADIAPGGYISIFGTGLSAAGSTTTAQINGQPAPVLVATPFQVNAQVPAGIPAGPATLTINAGANSAQQTITLKAVAPAIFSAGTNQAAITNQDNTLNTPSNPAVRGKAIIIYGTGLGATTLLSGLATTAVPTTVVVGGIELTSLYSGLTPGFVGLYQVNVILAAALPPGLALPLYLKEAGTVSNTVSVAVQ